MKPIVTLHASRIPVNQVLSLTPLHTQRLSLLIAQDIRVTSVEDGEGGAAVQLSAGGAELDLYQDVVSQSEPSKV